MKRFLDSVVAFAMAVLTIGLMTATPAVGAATKYWSGTGTWDSSSINWGTTPGGPYNTTFNTGDDAVFEGTAGTVTVWSPNNPNSIAFDVTGYTLSGGTITFDADPCTITTGSGISATISSVPVSYTHLTLPTILLV